MRRGRARLADERNAVRTLSSDLLIRVYAW